MQHPWSQASAGCIWEFRKTPFFYATAENTTQACHLLRKGSTAAASLAGQVRAQRLGSRDPQARRGCARTPSARTDAAQPGFPSWAETRGAVAEMQLWQLAARLGTVHIKQKSFWQLFHMCRQTTYPSRKAAVQVYLRLLKLLDLPPVTRRHAHRLHSVITTTLAFTFLPPGSAVCFSPLSSTNTGKDE